MARDGAARTPDATYCNKKICFAATDIRFLAELHPEPGIRPLLVLQLAAVLFDVELLDPGTERFDPLLGPAKADHVADVEIDAHQRTLQLVDEPSRLDRAQQEVVPDVLDQDLDAQVLGQRQAFADLGLRPLVGVLVGHLLVADARYQQRAGCTVGLGVPDRPQETLAALGTNLFVLVRKRLAPVVVTHDAMDNQARLVPCPVHLVVIQPNVDVDTGETLVQQQAELLFNTPLAGNHTVLDRLAELDAVSLGLGSNQPLLPEHRAGGEGRGGQERAAVDRSGHRRLLGRPTTGSTDKTAEFQQTIQSAV